MKEKKIVPVFYACDDNFIKYGIVSLHSMIKNASRDYLYKVCFLHNGISERMMNAVLELADECFEISFENVSDYLESVSDKLPIRDYYSKSTYYRLFIAEMFTQYSKAIYIDCDTIVTDDISELFNTDIGDYYLGACHEQAMVQVDVYGTYAEKVVGISRHNFFNAGIILINCEAFRSKKVLYKFISKLGEYNFVVTQDEDYLNLICKDHVYFLDQRWNTEVFCDIPYDISEAKILHYIMTSKPWHYADCKHGDIFWSYAGETSVYNEIAAELDNYSDEEKKNDALVQEKLLQLAITEINRKDNYLNRINKNTRASDRVEILKKIDEYERDGRFDEDVEDDPPTRELLPDEIEYIKKSLIQKLKSKLAYFIAHRFLKKQIKAGNFIVKDIKGIENFKALDCGAIVTCNHFNAFDSFAIQLAYEASKHKKRRFYRVIREGNYTSFPGFYGFLMRNCHTLPLSSNRKTMAKFVKATNTLLRDGHFVLVYPEQSMWWNYRKPKPLQNGAFVFAARNSVPVLPCFITMQDSDIMGEDGFYVQEYTIHISKPIYPDSEKSFSENVEYMMKQNYDVWKDIYENFYNIPLEYITNKADK